MATRMQQRRGTAAQWISTHNGDGPILNPGELGFESDTGKFKIGDGVNHWIDLDYFLDESEINSITGDYVLASTLAQANGVATLDGSGKLTFSQVPNIDELSQDAVNAALVAGTGLDKTYNDNANTITIDIDSTVATKTYADDAVSTAVAALTKSSVGLSNVDNTSDTDKPISDDTQAALDLKAPLASPTFTGTVSGITATMVGLGNVDNTSDANKPISTATQTALDLKANLASPTFTGTVITDDLEIGGSLTFSGTATEISSTTTVIEDPLIYLADGNPGNINDLGFVANYNDGTYAHTGLVRDASAGTWKLFKGVTDEPTNTVNFSQGTLDDLAINSLTASSITVGDVSNTEFGYLNGVTSAIQTQINDKLNSSTAASTYAPLASPTFTGTVILPNSTVTNDMLAGSIANNKLLNSSVTINGSSVSLGGSVTIQAGPDEIMVLMGAL